MHLHRYLSFSQVCLMNLSFPYGAKTDIKASPAVQERPREIQHHRTSLPSFPSSITRHVCRSELLWCEHVLLHTLHWSSLAVWRMPCKKHELSFPNHNIISWWILTTTKIKILFVLFSRLKHPLISFFPAHCTTPHSPTYSDWNKDMRMTDISEIVDNYRLKQEIQYTLNCNQRPGNLIKIKDVSLRNAYHPPPFIPVLK